MCRESVLRRVLGYGCDHLGDTPRFLDSYCYYYDENSNTKDYALTAAQAEQVYAALMQDVQDSDNGGSDIFAVQEYQYDPPSFWLELYFESTNEKGRPEVYTLSPHVNGSTPNTLQVLSELLPELKSNIVTPPSDDAFTPSPPQRTFHRGKCELTWQKTQSGGAGAAAPGTRKLFSSCSRSFCSFSAA